MVEILRWRFIHALSSPPFLLYCLTRCTSVPPQDPDEAALDAEMLRDEALQDAILDEVAGIGAASSAVGGSGKSTSGPKVRFEDSDDGARCGCRGLLV